jgi:hypothetical protein
MAKLVNLKLDEIVVGEGVRKIIDEDSIQGLPKMYFLETQTNYKHQLLTNAIRFDKKD